MIRSESALEIVLNDKTPATPSRREVVVPLSSTEDLVAVRGLSAHLDVIYRAVLKNSKNPDRSLFAIYEFLSEDMEEFIGRARSFAEKLDLDKPETTASRIQAAAAISQLIYGQRAHRTGVWLKGKAKEEKLFGVLSEVIGSGDERFYELQSWGYKSARRNLVFWRQELENARGSKHVVQLREAIDESDHDYFEV